MCCFPPFCINVYQIPLYNMQGKVWAGPSLLFILWCIWLYSMSFLLCSMCSACCSLAFFTWPKNEVQSCSFHLYVFIQQVFVRTYYTQALCQSTGSIINFYSHTYYFWFSVLDSKALRKIIFKIVFLKRNI